MNEPARISLNANGDFIVEFPGQKAEGQSVVIPCTPTGTKCLQRVLAERQYTKIDKTIGMKGSPTQWDVEAVMRALKRERKENATLKRQRDRNKRIEEMAELAAIDLEIDI